MDKRLLALNRGMRRKEQTQESKKKRRENRMREMTRKRRLPKLLVLGGIFLHTHLLAFPHSHPPWLKASSLPSILHFSPIGGRCISIYLSWRNGEMTHGKIAVQGQRKIHCHEGETHRKVLYAVKQLCKDSNLTFQGCQ